MENLVGDRGAAANDVLSSMLKDNKVFSLSRIGLAEVRWVDWYIKGGMQYTCDGFLFSGNLYAPTLREKLVNNGVYGGTEEYFMREYIKGISSADLQVLWNHYNGDKLVYDEQINIFNNFSKDSTKIDCEVLCPYVHTNFWTKELKGKKVLIIYPFVETIKSQYLKKDLIWTGEHAGKLPDFELITYKPYWSVGSDKPHSSWQETFEKMRDDISKLDFDVAILGCSHYGLPLVAHIKNNMNKSAIYMGGELQILFGIKGERWDGWEKVNKFYNEHWTRSIDEKPDGFRGLATDNGCYW
jgi:hypothetical protein